MLPQKYLKKVIITDEASSAEARGHRLRKIRNLANLTRKCLCNGDLKLHTYKSWELGRFGGLPIDGAVLVIERVAVENVACTLEWLIYGLGAEPYIISNAMDSGSENCQILKEIMAFKSGYVDAIDFKIIDDALAPQFCRGDYVAGVKIRGDNIKTVLNQNLLCIVETIDNELMLRYLKASSEVGKFQLLITNFDNTSTKQTLVDAQLNFAAPIVRHYKPIP